MSMRFKLPPGGDVPLDVAARRMAMTGEEFREKLPELFTRGFPAADPTTGKFDLDAIDTWRKSRYPQIYRLPSSTGARDANDVVRSRLTRSASG